MNQFPLVSIIITTFNRVAYLERAVKSALSQDYTNLEIIISDNASSDATEGKCIEWASSDTRIKYFRNPTNIGSENNHRVAFTEYAKGDWVVFVSDDDYLSKTSFISKGITEIINLDGNVAFYQTGVDVLNEINNEVVSAFPKINQETQVFQPTTYFLDYFNILFFSFTTTILNRKQILEEKLIEKRFRFDVELLLIMSLSRIAILSKEINGVYTIHSNQLFASSAFFKYISIFKCYTLSAEYALKGKFLEENKIKAWVFLAKGYFYQNIVGWVSNFLNKNINSLVIVTKNRRLNIVIENIFFVEQVYYLSLFKDYNIGSSKKYHRIYLKGLWYEFVWYLYSNFKIKKLFFKF